MKHSDSIAAIANAFASAQAEFVPVRKTKTAKVKGTSKNGKDYDYTYQYADLADILEMAIPRLSRQGLAFSQPHCMVDGKLRVVSYLLHKSGEWMHSDGIEISELSPDPQQLGIESTYFRRYDGSSFLGIAPDEDTDGQTGDRTPRQTEDGNNKPSNLCPVCGKDTIIQGKREYGGGWLCYKAKGGCGAKFDTEPTAEKISETPKPTSTQQSAQQATQRAANAPASNQPEEQGVFKHLPDGVLVCKVRGVTEKHTDPRDGKTKPKPYLIVTVNGYLHPEGDPDNPNINGLFCYDTGLFDAIKSGVGKEVHLKIDLTTKFAKALDVLEVDGVEYVDGKPVTGA